MRAYLDHCVQVSTLEVAVEDGLVLLLECWIHALEDAGAFGLEVGVKLAEIGG
jgi:hypothetical protein